MQGLQKDSEKNLVDDKIFLVAKKVLKNRFEGLVKEFLEDTTLYIKGVEQGFEERNLMKIADNAHPLKSSSQSLGVVKLAEVAKYIELSAREGVETEVSGTSAVNQEQYFLEQFQEAISVLKITAFDSEKTLKNKMHQ